MENLISTTMDKQKIILELTEIVNNLNKSQKSNQKLGKISEFISEDKDGHLVVDLSGDKGACVGLNPCAVNWGEVVMTEKCRSMVYTPGDTQHPLRFIFDYFFDCQSLWVFPERLNSEKLQYIIDWLKKMY